MKLPVIARLDDSDYSIAFGGGEDPPPRIGLSKGENTTLELPLGSPLDVSCFLRRGNPEEYNITWVLVKPPGRALTLSANQELRIDSMSADDFENEIYCRATRHWDGEEFDKRLLVKPREFGSTPSDEATRERSTNDHPRHCQSLHSHHRCLYQRYSHQLAHIHLWRSNKVRDSETDSGRALIFYEGIIGLSRLSTLH